MSTIDYVGVIFGANVRKARAIAGLTQEELADRLDSYRPIVGRVEAGRHTPTMATVWEYAAALGVPAHRLVDGVDEYVVSRVSEVRGCADG